MWRERGRERGGKRERGGDEFSKGGLVGKSQGEGEGGAVLVRTRVGQGRSVLLLSSKRGTVCHVVDDMHVLLCAEDVHCARGWGEKTRGEERDKGRTSLGRASSRHHTHTHTRARAHNAVPSCSSNSLLQNERDRRAELKGEASEPSSLGIFGIQRRAAAARPSLCLRQGRVGFRRQTAGL